MTKRLIQKHPYSINPSLIKFYAELHRSKQIKDYQMPDNIVKMDSVVTIEKTQTADKLTIKLVYPDQEQLNTFQLSIFSAVGMTLFAQKLGATISCFEQERKVQLKIVSIV